MSIDRSEIVRLYLSGLNGEEVGARLGITRGRVYQILGMEGVPRRHRGATLGVSHEECADAFARFIELGGSSMRQWDRWAAKSGAPSIGTMRNRGYGPRFAALDKPGLPVFDDVRLPTRRGLDRAKQQRGVAVAWLFANGCESAKSLSEYVGHRLSTRRVPHMAARRRGTYGWAASELDRIHPDLTCEQQS